MKSLIKKNILILSTILMVINIMFMPLRTVFADLIEKQEKCIEEVQENDNQIFFENPHIKATVDEIIEVTVISDQEISSVEIYLPEKTILDKESLDESLIIQSVRENIYKVHSEELQNSFTLFLSINSPGKYEGFIEDEKIIFEISEKENQSICVEEEKNFDNLDKFETIETAEPLENKEVFADLEKIIVVDNLGNVISGNDQFSPDEIFVPQLTTTSIAGNNMVRNVGKYRGKEIDLMYNQTSSRASLAVLQNGSRRYLHYGTNFSPEFTDNITITAVYSGTSEIIDAKLYIPINSINYWYNISPRFTLTFNNEDVFRIVRRQSVQANQIQFANDKFSFMTSQNNNFDFILDNNSTISVKASTHTNTTALLQIHEFHMFFSNPMLKIGFEGEIEVNHLDIDNQAVIETEIFTGQIGWDYNTSEIKDPNYELVSFSNNTIGYFTSEKQFVTYYYRLLEVNPKDPLKPDVGVQPENKPELPENQRQLSIDFISFFDFGSQVISVHDQTYYAKPQRLLNKDGTINESEERPNYVQISDRRSENERNGWTLAVTQKEQFKGEENQVLYGASLSLLNQQVLTAQGGTAPEIQSIPCNLVPGNRRTLLKAQGDEGTGTWIYRFGDGKTAGESVALNVPKGTNPESTTYSTTLIWELSAVPDN